MKSPGFRRLRARDYPTRRVGVDRQEEQPYLNEDQAYELLRDALDDRALEHVPARIVIHK
jgi:hypothetical protein